MNTTKQALIIVVALSMPLMAFAADGASDKTITTATVKSPEPPRDASLIGARPSTGAQQVRPPSKAKSFPK